MIEPKPIPEFKPKKRVFRMDGVVIWFWTFLKCWDEVTD